MIRMNRETKAMERNRPFILLRAIVEPVPELRSRCVASSNDVNLDHWIGTRSLGAYLLSPKTSHYDWALKVMRRGVK